MRQNSATLNSVNPAGRRFMGLMVALNTGDRQKLNDFIRESHSSMALAGCSIDELTAWYETIYRETGGISVHHVYSSTENFLIVVVRGRDNDLLYMDKIKVETTQPHKILEYHHALLDG
jgi:hypothetical protein